jgi:hypothetical protein
MSRSDTLGGGTRAYVVVNRRKAVPEALMDIATALRHHKVVDKEPPGLQPGGDILVNHHLSV